MEWSRWNRVLPSALFLVPTQLSPSHEFCKNQKRVEMSFVLETQQQLLITIRLESIQQFQHFPLQQPYHPQLESLGAPLNANNVWQVFHFGLKPICFRPIELSALGC